MKAFHFLLFHGSFIFPECILIFGLILLLMIEGPTPVVTASSIAEVTPAPFVPQIKQPFSMLVGTS
ncbi:hypothetical protein BAE44_0025547 [Dichanthelium oligosanthes]|uniref:NAD(P)H-quinone oxidoreductase subunit 2 N-terminal domain-containing protein n=1 Tax=Dichanthelium oligosanthes TaxID=888268 RepID=A0A1E5UKN4_9POAL|nr:hypothetical protein BAE44_0025547 [Dichanthelium oligosanthes]